MILKIKLKLTAVLLCIFSHLCLANEPTQTIAEPCQQLFQAIDKLMTEAERQPGTHMQLSNIQTKFNQSKQQIMQMDMPTQLKSCDKGLAKLNHLKKAEEQENN